MPVKKVKDVTPETETTVFEELNAQEMKEEQVVVEKKEEALPVSLVEKMMKELEEKLLNKFTSQINKLKTAEAQKTIDSDLQYVEELKEDWLEQPVVFFAFSMNFSIHGDKKRGVETLPPHGAIKFKPLVRTKRKRNRDVQVISVSSIKVNSASEVEYLRNHSQYGIAFFENMTSAMAVDSTWAQKMMEWGFDKEFIAKDCGINLASLETRLRRASERERNGNQGTKSGTSGSQPNS